MLGESSEKILSRTRTEVDRRFESSVAAAMVYSDRAEVIRSIMTTGRLPDMDDRLKQKKLAELPGMKELMEDPKDEFVDSFEKLIMESLCFVKDVTA